jgi:hypothetical protein
MFYMLANVHHQIATGEVLPLTDCLLSREAPQSTILSDTARTDVPLLRTFLEILSGNGSEYDIDCYAPLCMCYHIDSEVLAEEPPGLTPSDQSPRSRAAYIQEKEDCLWARQVDLDTTEAELECQRQDLAWKRATNPLGDDDHMGAPSGLFFPRAAYNMAATACCLKDISDTPDPKTNERLNKAKRLLRVALEQ